MHRRAKRTLATRGAPASLSRMNDDRSLISLLAGRGLVLAAALLAASCGGGGDAAATAPAAVSAAAVAASGPAVAASGPAPTGAASATGSTCGVADFAATALARLNQMRAAGADCRSSGRFAPAASLGWSASLTQAAERHSQDMVAHDFFAHTGADGSTLADRVNATGYAWRTLGENIAAGQVGIEAALGGWLASDGHCANLMNPDFTEIGLVCVAGNANTRYATYWTMDLARAR